MDGSYSDSLIQNFVKQSVVALDSLNYVKRYAFFGDYPGKLINSDGSGLSSYGELYNNYTG